MTILEPAFRDLSVGLPNPGSLETPADILTALRELEAEESQIDEELSAVMSDKVLLDALLDRIDSVRPVVEQVQQEASELARRVEETADIAERISGKVRQLDLEQSRVAESIEMVQAVQDLKTSLSALATSVDKRDWETATRNMQRAMTVDKKVVSSGFAEAVVPTGELPLPPEQTLDEFRTTLLSVFLREFEKASSERDEANTSRFFKLFPMISAEREGLDAYAKFVCSIVSNRSKGSLQQQASSPTFFASLLTPLFEQIAIIISQHQPVVEKYYGHGRMVPVASKLQEECDKQANAILSQWEEERRTSRKVIETQRYKYPHLATYSNTPQLPQPAGVAALKRPYQQLSRQSSHSSVPTPAADEEAIDPRDIDAVLSELSQISGRWELYRRFLYSRFDTGEEAAAGSRVLASPCLQNSPDASLEFKTPRPGQSEFAAKAHVSAEEATLSFVEASTFKANLAKQLISVYEPLELWYLRSSIEKAHQLDEPDMFNKPFLSSSLDDTFFILKKVLLRLVTTSSLQSHKRMCTEISIIMERDFSEVLRKRMDTVWSTITATTQAARSKEEAAARQSFIIYANDLDTAAEYVVRLVEEVIESDTLGQSYFLASEYDQAKEALESMKVLQERFRGSLKAGLDQLFNQLIRPRLRPMLSECYRDVTYLLDEDSYSEAEYQDLVRKRFVRSWQTLVEPYKDSLTTTNYQLIFTLTISVLSRLWESQLKSMKFTELGALRFDRDLRSITSFLSNQTAFGVSVLRDSFSRIQQIGMLLSVESPADADDLVSSSGWKLSQQEMLNLLNLRV